MVFMLVIASPVSAGTRYGPVSVGSAFNRMSLMGGDRNGSPQGCTRQGRKDTQVLGEVLDAFAAWLDSVIDWPYEMN